MDAESVSSQTIAGRLRTDDFCRRLMLSLGAVLAATCAEEAEDVPRKKGVLDEIITDRPQCISDQCLERAATMPDVSVNG